MKKISVSRLFLIGLLLCFGVTGCGKEKDPQTTEVMKISPALEDTPTPTPKVIQSSAVTTNGELTMVNEFRVSNDTAQAEAAAARTVQGEDETGLQTEDVSAGAEDMGTEGADSDES